MLLFKSQFIVNNHLVRGEQEVNLPINLPGKILWKLIEIGRGTGARRGRGSSIPRLNRWKLAAKIATVAKPRAKHSLTFPTRGNDRRVRSDAAAFTSRFPRTVR